ncbi:DUF6731 family protein [Ferrovum sp.]|uniref:DUF6731 family protein n=1 Tax=Ferrovum sp. TaxID=2609467 RepID=UPI0026306D28|nr:DUF6731 family protein [Ferrovum sp.]
MSQKREYTADFYCFEEGNNRNSTALRDLLDMYNNRHAPAYSIDDDALIKYQIRSIRSNHDKTVFKAVFGKLRHDGAPEQASENSVESDIELLPEHGLVEKSHFLFFSDINLVVFQRNRNAGSKSHLQAYLNKPTYASRVLVSVPTRDSYTRLMQGGPIKKVEFSLRKPAFSSDQEDALLTDLVKVFSDSNASRIKITLSASVGGSLLDNVKEAIVGLTRFGRTSVARATMVNNDEIIDLMVDRVVHSFSVELIPNRRRPDAESVFAGLAEAKDACASQLSAYFCA